MKRQNNPENLLEETPARIFSMSKGLDLVSKVVAPTTLLTALLFYFGYVRTYNQFLYFGIDPNILGLTSTDYLLRSVAVVGFDSLRFLFVAILIASWMYFVIEKALVSLKNSRKLWLCWIIVILILVLGITLILGIVKWLDPREILYRYLYRLAWTVGILLTGYGFHLVLKLFSANFKKSNSSSSISIIPNWLYQTSLWSFIGLFVFGVFWTAADYGAVLGDWMAEQIALGNRHVSCAFIYSKTPLNITDPNVKTQKISDEENAYQYVYYGLRFLIRANDKYFLIPVGWTRESGSAIILQDENTIRVEFAPDDFKCMPSESIQ